MNVVCRDEFSMSIVFNWTKYNKWIITNSIDLNFSIVTLLQFLRNINTCIKYFSIYLEICFKLEQCDRNSRGSLQFELKMKCPRQSNDTRNTFVQYWRNIKNILHAMHGINETWKCFAWHARSIGSIKSPRKRANTFVSVQQKKKKKNFSLMLQRTSYNHRSKATIVTKESSGFTRYKRCSTLRHTSKSIPVRK